MALLLKDLLLKVLRRNFSDRRYLVAWKGQKKLTADHSAETGLRLGTESQKGTETGIETGTERETEASVAEGVHSVTERGGEAVTEWTGGTG